MTKGADFDMKREKFEMKRVLWILLLVFFLVMASETAGDAYDYYQSAPYPPAFSHWQHPYPS